jgi:hypothetical protein
MTRLFAPVLVLAWCTVVGVAAPQQPPAAQTPQRSLETSPVRRAQMSGHYRAVTVVYEAVIRGDLPAGREAAITIWGLAPPAGISPTGVQIAEFVKLEGQRAAQAGTIPQAARSAAAMLTLCGDCHTAVNVRVAAPDARPPDVGGIVGHMLAHQEAVQAMAEGLVAPSPSRWRTGAERLVTAALRGSEFPPDPGMGPAVRQSEIDVHAIGQEAVAAGDKTARTATFAKLIGTCANCHRLHSRIWGPRTLPSP